MTELEYNKEYVENYIHRIYDNYKKSGIRGMENVTYDLDDITNMAIEKINKDKVIGYRMDNYIFKAINRYINKQADRERAESRKRDREREKRILNG